MTHSLLFKLDAELSGLWLRRREYARALFAYLPTIVVCLIAALSTSQDPKAATNALALHYDRPLLSSLVDPM